MASSTGVDLSLSGLASGFDWKSLIDQLAAAERSPQTQLRNEQNTINQRNNAYGSIKTELSVLQNKVATLQDATLYDSRTSSVSDTSVATASAANGAASGSYVFSITQLATASKRVGTSNVGSPLTTANSLATAGFSTPITAGTFSVNGKQITIATTDTLDSVFTKISDATSGAVTASYDSANDKIVLSSSSEIVLGSATDTSNFLQVTKLYNNGSGSVTSANSLGGVLLTGSLSTANLATTISDGGSGAGEFKINGVSISFDATNDSISNVLARINNSAAGVIASYDSVNDRFQLTSKSTGDMNISLEDVTGNFLAATGLTASTLTRGKNLLYTVNGGDQLVSQSNTITEASSGITGLSVTAVKNGSTTVTVSSDTAKIQTAITDFISQYNRVQSLIDTDTASSTDADGTVSAGVLAQDSDASDIASALRRAVFSQVSGLSGLFNHLADLGIQTNGDDNNLTLQDNDALTSALTDDLDSVKQLFSDSTNGIAVQLNKFLDHTIGEDGTLVTKQTNLTKQSSDIDTQVTNMEKLVQDDIDKWTNEFVAMETAQEQMTQQLNYLLRQFPSS